MIEILRGCGANLVSDSEILLRRSPFVLFSVHTPIPINADQSTVIFTADCKAFRSQRLSAGMTGICEEGNAAALAVLQANKIPVITCGMDPRNTMTLSGVSDLSVSAGLQRTLTDKNGRELSPAEYPILLKKSYTPFAVMASAAALLYEGVSPTRF